MANTPFTREIIKAISQGRNVIRGLPEPNADLDSLYNTVVGLKEAVETLLRSRNAPGESALLVKELDPLFKVIEFQINQAVSKLEIPDGDLVTSPDIEGLAPRADVDIQLDFNTAAARGFKEFIYDQNNKVSRIDIWEDGTRAIQLFTKRFEYNQSLQVTRIVTTDLVSGKVLTKSLTYDGTNVATLTETVIG